MRVLIGIVVLTIVAAWATSALAWNMRYNETTIIEGVTQGKAECYAITDRIYGDGYRCDLWKYENATSTPQTLTYRDAFEAPACTYINTDPPAKTTQTTLILPADMLAPFIGYVQVFACHPPKLNRK